MIKKIAAASAAVLMMAGVASAAAVDVNMYGASAQYLFWTGASADFLTDMGCSGVTTAESGEKSGLATGTGTDQIAVACRLGDGAPLGGAGKHCKLGELIGRCVKKGVMQTLALQNKLTPAGQCSARIHLARFGADKERFVSEICSNLDQKSADLLGQNFTEIDRDPPTVAAAAALVHLWDKLAWGVLPESCRPEIMGSYGAQLAAAVSGDHERLSWYRKELAPLPGAGFPDDLLALACKAIALGFADKWSKEG